jgi:UDP-2,4-diacetamido-2,4,6-trideoxy-beta-L-altropyranose hydrolase
MDKQIFFRLECTPKLGIGHFMRCISLANELINDNNVFFVYSNHLIKKYRKFGDKRIQYLNIKKKLDVDNFRVNAKKKQIQDAAEFIKFLKIKKEKIIVIVDCYSLDYIWEQDVKRYTTKLVVIDDLASRYHHCDYLIDQTLNRSKLNYKNYLIAPCKLLLGSKYCIIRRQYKELISNQKKQIDLFQRLNISFGNFDDKNLVLRSLIEINKSTYKFKRIDVFISRHSKNYTKVEKFKEKSGMNFKLFSDAKNFPKMLSKSSLCIGAGGTTSWERCLMLVPSIIIKAANNQDTIISELKKEKLIYYSGTSKSKNLDIIGGIKYYNNIKNLKFFKNKAKQTFDIDGIKRIIQKINA